MTIKEFAYLILKIIGIYCIIRGLLSLGSIFLAARMLPGSELVEGEFIRLGSFIVTMVPFVLLMLFGFFLLKYTKLVGHMMGLQETGESTEMVRIKEAQTVAFSIVGVILVATAIPKFFHIVGRAIYDEHWRVKMAGVTAKGFELWTPANVGTMIELTALTVLGLYLFFQAEGIARLWEKFRGREKLIE